MNTFIKYTCVFFVLVSSVLVHSQDYHYAQFDALPLNLNPALIGDRADNQFSGVRFTSGYRDQQSNFTSAPASYRSLALGLDFLIGQRFSNGAFFSNTRSPYSIFGVTNINYGASYKMIGSNASFEDKHQLSVGLQLGLLMKSFAPGEFTYDQQYSPNTVGGFDPSLPSGENFQSTVKFHFSCNTGLSYKANLDQGKLVINAGVSIYNITKSTERYNGILLPVPLHYNAHFSAAYKLDERITLVPQALFMYQTGAYELMLGSLLYYHLNGRNKIILGSNWRQKNAVIVQAGFSTGGITLRTSYCIGTGYLAQFNNRGLEFSLTYINSKKNFPSIKN